MKLSLWSCRVINASAFTKCSIRSANFKFFAICFASRLVEFANFRGVSLYAFVVLFSTAFHGVWLAFFKCYWF